MKFNSVIGIVGAFYSSMLFAQTNTFPSSGNVGIGTTSPSSRLEVSQGPASFSNSNYDRVQLGTPERTVLSVFGTPNGTPYVLSGGTGNVVPLAVGSYSAADLTLGTSNLARMTIKAAGNVGIGTTTPLYLLSVNGIIGTKEVIVTSTGWSDYVFQPGYRLRPLSEVNKYIEANHHLPDIPSEAEVMRKGISLGEMQAKLLAQIEELTLHMIQQENENKELHERIARLEAGSPAHAASAAAQ